METRIRSIPDDIWRDFKRMCVDEGVSMNQKVVDLVAGTVERWRSNEKQRLRDRLNDLQQSRL